MAHEIFVSYSSKDVEPVRILVKRLEGAGASVWLDEKRLTPAGYFDEELKGALNGCKAVLLMASPAAMASDWVRGEVIAASFLGKPIIPCHLEPITLPQTLEPILSPLEYIKAYQGDPEDTFRKLVSALISLGIRIHPGSYFDKVGPYAIERPPIHAGEHAEIFAADDASGRLAVHVLAMPDAETEEAREWFKRRLECWQKVRHPNVLSPRDSSNPKSERPSPYIVTDLVPQSLNLQQIVEQPGRLTWDDATTILRTAAEICRAAHERNIYLISLPLRHFLQGATKEFLLTGFEAAASGEDNDRHRHREFLQHFCSKDCSDVAPEILQDPRPLAETVDIFALGVLLESLQRIHRKEGRPMQELDGSQRSDPTNCFAYHCLAADPNLRFQTIDQFLRFLEKESLYSAPVTVEVPGGPVTYLANGRYVQEDVPPFRIGKYPVTNFEYERFCREEDRWGKNTLMTHSLSAEETGSYGSSPLERRHFVRLSGPFCPAVYVSLLDARKYCEWLSRRTKKRWRVPRESEWIRAAVMDKDQPYPWGDEGPTAAHTNFGRLYSGPTVVGAFPRGCSTSGCWDMAGNIWEWCSDFVAADEPKHVLKGGSYDFSAGALRAAARQGAIVSCRSPHVGFRILCEG